MIAQKHVPPDYCTCGIHGRLWAIYCTSTQCSTVNCFHRTLKLFPIWIMKGFCWSSGYVLMGLIKSSPYLPEQRCCQLLLLFFSVIYRMSDVYIATYRCLCVYTHIYVNIHMFIKKVHIYCIGKNQQIFIWEYAEVCVYICICICILYMHLFLCIIGISRLFCVYVCACLLIYFFLFIQI